MFYYVNLHIVIHSFGPESLLISQMISCFIEDHKGRFPNSEKELISEGYLRIEQKNGNRKYLFRCNKEIQKWSEFRMFDSFDIRYGVNYEDYELKKGRLYTVESNEAILLIEINEIKYYEDSAFNFPSPKLMKSQLEKISADWYMDMKLYKYKR